MGYSSVYKSMKSNNYSDKSNYLKKVTQILLSVSVFSFFFSQSSLVHSYDYLVSNFDFKFKLFTYTTERNCIFLLCNGILVLIIQSSGLISKITPTMTGLKDASFDDHHGRTDSEIGRLQENENKDIRKDQTVEEKMREDDGNIAAQVEDYQSCGIPEEEEQVINDADELNEEEEEVIDAVELNKKCEDFIKKMKQEIQGA